MIPYIIIGLTFMFIMMKVTSLMDQKYIEKSDVVYSKNKLGNFTRSIK